jgi:hypothetical protein
MAQYCKKLAAMSRLVTSVFWIMAVLRDEPAGGDLLLNEKLGGERLEGLLTWLEGDAGEIGEGFASPMENGGLVTFASPQSANIACSMKW